MISVEKDSFIKVLHHYSDSSIEEAKEVLSLKESYPYSQLLHALSARLAKDHGFSTQQAELQMAAVYAADRGVLKEVMTREAIILEYPTKTSASVQSIPVAISAQVTTSRQPVVQSTTNEDLAEEVMHDLERLTELRHNFEMMFDEKVTASITPTHTPVEETEEESSEEEAYHKDTTKSKKERIKELARAMQATKPEPAAEESAKSRKERIIELAKAAQATAESEEQEHTKPKTRKKKNENSSEELIDEIVSSKEELTLEGDKQKEQLEIIEQFIKIQPSITPAKEKSGPPPSGDLSTIKTGEFGDNVVSETLVEILIKQGKKDKAIEVLKKLIWKFPQKKAYFAAQIEDLRK
ncbi:MAG TPA: hypothetical protein VIN08_26745 [Ohtaekwangia sp.]|uniref:hypothetical protein n=1 Tax=Ohtaekwangia sp. TaxID=2066019 RepID=UPI002F94EFA9